MSDYLDLVTQQMRLEINSAQKDLIANKNLIFSGEIYDNQGKLRCGKNQVIDDKELLRSINWLVRGVEVVE